MPAQLFAPRRGALIPILLFAAAACAPGGPASSPEPRAGLPPVPRVEGPLDVRVAYPSSGGARPARDSTFIFGTTGTGAATLRINGAPVTVAPNGGFLAFLPVPADGVWRLVAEAGGQTDSARVAYAVPQAPDSATLAARARAAAANARVAFGRPTVATVFGVRDTLATGSDIAPGYPVASTEGDRRWLLPNGARFAVVARRGNLVEARLDAGTTAFFSAAQLRLDSTGTAPTTPAAAPALELRPAAAHADVRLPVGFAPFRITGDDRTIRLAVHGVALPQGAPNVSGDRLLAGAAWDRDSAGVTTLELRLRPGVWGYKAFYEPDGTLVLRLRRPPTLDARAPLRGLRIVVDAGHPPGGAIGPTGLTEAQATLPVSMRLAEKLRRAGAEVLMTRTTPEPLGLTERVDFAVRNDAHLLVSVHFNAFADGQNPFRSYGSSVLYYHPHSRDFAGLLDRELVAVTRIPDKGPLYQNIALGRPTWMPAALTESLFMMFPEQESALRDPEFQDRLATAHVRGIEAFVRARAEDPSAR